MRFMKKKKKFYETIGKANYEGNKESAKSGKLEDYATNAPTL